MPKPPTGTVSFLFPDIEGRTWRWDQKPEAIKNVPARCDTILRSSIEARGLRALIRPEWIFEGVAAPLMERSPAFFSSSREGTRWWAVEEGASW